MPPDCALFSSGGVIEITQRNSARTRPVPLAGAAYQEDSNHGVVTLATKIPIVEDCKKSLSLFSSQPVANPQAVFLPSFHASDACREIRTEKSPIRSLVGEPGNSCKAQVNGGRRLADLFQTYPVSGHDGGRDPTIVANSAR